MILGFPPAFRRPTRVSVTGSAGSNIVYTVPAAGVTVTDPLQIRVLMDTGMIEVRPEDPTTVMAGSFHQRRNRHTVNF